MTAYYNEFDPHAADWLENLIREGVIAHGIVDCRDIRDVEPRDLDGFTQCHFFAGIGVWPYALRLAGWPDSRPVWTGSCPCQPFSAAGKGNGFADERHLWPAWQWLIEQCRLDTIFGEQVASKDGLAWFDLVLSDLEGAGYAVGVQDTCAAGFGAPHIRQRLFFVGHAERLGAGRNARAGFETERGSIVRAIRDDARSPSATGFVADAESQRLLGRQDERDGGRRECASGQGREVGELEHAARDGREQRRPEPSERGTGGGRGESELGDAERFGCEGWNITEDMPARRAQPTGDQRWPGPTNGLWRDADWLGCTDGKWRPVEPGTFPLAPRVAFDLGSGSAFEGKSRAKMLKGYGNAINAEVARNFIEAYLDCEAERLVDIFS